MTSTAYAADVVCEGTYQLQLGAEPANPVLSPDGKTMLFTTNDYTGLKALNLVDGTVTTIDDGRAAGFNPVFAPDGSKVFFRTASMKGNLVYRDLVSYDLKTKKRSQLIKPTRDDISVAADSRAVRIRSAKGYVAGTNGKDARYVVDNFEKINVIEGNTLKEISPLADAYTYQWASLSPDGQRILFTEPFQGVFVCGIDGSNPVRLVAKGDSPRWVSDDVIVTIISKDDGYGLLESHLVAVEISTGKVTPLTADDVLTTEVSVCPATRQMAYSTLDGKMFITNLVIR